MLANQLVSVFVSLFFLAVVFLAVGIALGIEIERKHRVNGDRETGVWEDSTLVWESEGVTYQTTCTCRRLESGSRADEDTSSG